MFIHLVSIYNTPSGAYWPRRVHVLDAFRQRLPRKCYQCSIMFVARLLVSEDSYTHQVEAPIAAIKRLNLHMAVKCMLRGHVHLVAKSFADL